MAAIVRQRRTAANKLRKLRRENRQRYEERKIELKTLSTKLGTERRKIKNKINDIMKRDIEFVKKRNKKLAKRKKVQSKVVRNREKYNKNAALYKPKKETIAPPLPVEFVMPPNEGREVMPRDIIQAASITDNKRKRNKEGEDFEKKPKKVKVDA